MSRSTFAHVQPAEAGGQHSSSSRRSFLRGTSAAALMGGAGALLGVPSITRAGHDAGAVRKGHYTNFRAVRRHENAHVAFLLDVLAGAARPKPMFQGLEQPDYISFVTISQALEQTGVGAYLGATPFINSPDILGGAASIALIEASHVAFTNLVVDDPITGPAEGSLKVEVRELGPDMFFPLTPDEVGAAAGPFIAKSQRRRSDRVLRDTQSRHDVDILNFALALGYLEAEFYNINVQKFFEHG